MGNFLFYFFLTFINFGFGCRDFERGGSKNGRQPPPKTLVSSSPEHIKFYNGNYSVVIDAVGIEIRFDCWAPYPVDVRFKGHLTNRGVTVGLIERRASDPKDISAYCFSINVTLMAYEEITGEYSCVAVENDSIRSSHYIYHAAHPPETLLNRNQTLRVVMKRNEEWIILPCASSNPHVLVHLYQETMNGQLVKILQDNNLLRYNPQFGFTMPSILIDKNKTSKFRCETELSDLDFVNLLVLPPKPIIPTPAQRNLLMKEGDELRLTCESSEDVSFENSNQEIIGETTVLHQTSSSGEYLREYKTVPLKAGDRGIISCISTTTKEILFEWTFRTVKKENESTNMIGRHDHDHHHTLNSYECQLPNGEMRIALHECSNWVECNLRKCNNLDRKCTSVKCNDAKTSNCVQNGIIQCFNINKESAQSQIYFSDLQNKKMYTYWKTAPAHSILKISKFGKWPRLENVSLNFEAELMCDGSSFVFAVGFKWFLIQDNNGPPLPIPDAQIRHKWKHVESKNVIRSIVKMNITHDISQVICKAPIWNSTEWRQDVFNISKRLQQNTNINIGKSGGGFSLLRLPNYYNFYIIHFILSLIVTIQTL